MLQISPPPISLLKTLLDATDEFAVGTVQAGQGGPFGASIHIYDPRTQTVEQIGGLAANAVLKKGMASAHAENEIISPENVAMLKERLADYDRNTVQVILSSSGQSCPACTAKEEILARTLVAEGLIRAGNFIVTYGATFKDTFNIASFNDEPYQIDMEKEAGIGMVKKDTIEVDKIPTLLKILFENAHKPLAIITKKIKETKKIEILGIGYDQRIETDDLMATAEVCAIRAASSIAKDAGKETPWDLGGATIYTSTEAIGPLAYAECQWANVTKWVSVDHPEKLELATHEARKILNRDFFKVVGNPQLYPSDTITTIRIPDFANRAQYAWRERLQAEQDPSKILYNGIQTEAPNGP